MSPTKTVWAGIASVAVGPRFGTVTANACSADSPPGSVAVTVTVASPCAVARIDSVAPATETETAVASELSAE